MSKMETDNITTNEITRVNIKSEMVEFSEKCDTITHDNSSQEISADNIESLIKPEPEDETASDLDENLELTHSDLEKEFEEFNKEDEKSNSGITVLENNTTAYRCQMCQAIFMKFPEYKEHKKQHYIEKRRCKICNIVCQSIGKLEIHVNGHLGLRPYKCNECDKSFTSKHQVKLHKRCHSMEKRYKCDKCEKAFRNLGSLRSHALVHQEKIKEFICKICNEDCKILPNFRKHMESHGKVTDITCGVCNKRFASDRHLQTHLNTHKELQFPCEYCGGIYQSLYRLKRHIKRAHIPNHCDECDQIFYDRALFTKHCKQHNEGKPVTCDHCGKVFDKAKNLSEHIRLQHKEDDIKHNCPICGKEFINRALLKNHIKTHDKNFKCPHCDKVFSSRYNLETHSVTHTGARNHKCDICGKSYSTKSSLKNHKAIHTDDRKFKCDLCPKQFKTNRRLYVHKFSHATEEKFECEICHARFRVKQYLKYHMIKHSTVKPYRCEICTKRFKHKKSFEKHMLLGRHKKSSQEHDCDFCDDTFPSRDLLLEHFVEMHKDTNVINEFENMDEDGVNVKFEPPNSAEPEENGCEKNLVLLKNEPSVANDDCVL